MPRVQNSSFYNCVISLLLLNVGFGPVIDFFMPIRIAGKSFFITLLPFIFILVLSIKNLKKVRHNSFFFIFCLLLFFIFILRAFYYGEPFLNAVIGNMYFFYIPLLFIIFENHHFSSISINVISNIVLVTFIFHAFNSLFFLFNFPHLSIIDEYSDDFVANSRFTGIMGGANVQGHFIAILFMLLIYVKKNLSFLSSFLMALVAFTGIFPTFSRGGLISLFFTFAKKLYNLYSRGLIISKLLILFSIYFLILLVKDNLADDVDLIIGFFDRFNESDISGGRIDRLNFAYSLFSSKIEHIFIGIPMKLQNFSTVLSISDNSFLLVFANCGVIILVSFFSYIYLFFKRSVISSSDKFFYLLTLLITILLNNAFLYMQWCTFAIMGYYLITDKQIKLKY